MGPCFRIIQAVRQRDTWGHIDGCLRTQGISVYIFPDYLTFDTVGDFEWIWNSFPYLLRCACGSETGKILVISLLYWRKDTTAKD